MSEKILYMAHGKQYEIVVAPNENGFQIRTYRDGKQVGVTYGASYEVAQAFDVTASALTETGAVEALVNCAKSDLNLGITK